MNRFEKMVIGEKYIDDKLGITWKVLRKIENGVELQCVSGNKEGNGARINATPDTCKMNFQLLK